LIKYHTIGILAIRNKAPERINCGYKLEVGNTLKKIEMCPSHLSKWRRQIKIKDTNQMW
jgi:hypothetical protein